MQALLLFIHYYALRFISSSSHAATSDTAEHRKSMPLLRMPSKDQPSPPVSILRSSATPVLEDNSVTKSKPPIPLLKMGLPATATSDPPAPSKPVVPKLGLGSMSSMSPRAVPTADPAPLSSKSALKLSSPQPASPPPVVPSLKLGSLGRDSNPPLSPSSSSSQSLAGSPAKFVMPSLKLSNAAISPKGKPEPTAIGAPKKAAIPTLKLPPSRMKPEKEEPQEVDPLPLLYSIIF
jgi:hypothetical protein